jgi:NADPH-dependent glutamate synthase beta subunit-like oxidoreductase/NAD-dependent dihydropyrimidine dehydrogenase PreA subunit
MKKMYPRVDPEFKHKIWEVFGGDTFKYCYQCGTCTAACPLARLIDTYRPNKILHLAKLGIQNVVHSNAVWLCDACNSCIKVCPQGVKVSDIMYALKNMLFEKEYSPEFTKEIISNSIAILGQEFPFPVVYSLLCLRPSIEEAQRSKFDELVLNIRKNSLEEFEKTSLPKKGGEKIAVIGSGPAGLTAAWDLNRMGFPVIVFESLSKPGGMLRVGIPEFRLPKKIVDVEIEQIKDLGVEIRTKTPVNRDLFTDLLQGGEYKAIFIATGGHKSRKLRVEGENMKGVIQALNMLRDVNLKRKIRVGKRVIVVGGGNVAMDAARTALRHGAETVQLACLESRPEMPAHEWEIQEALKEGVVLNVSWGPKRILGDGKKVSGVEFKRCVSVFDEEGRFKPVYDESKTKKLDADTVILAIGQATELSFLGEEVNIVRGVVVVDPMTMKTNLPGVFAGGDVVSGPASVLEAIVAGKVAAASIIQSLTGE